MQLCKMRYVLWGFTRGWRLLFLLPICNWDSPLIYQRHTFLVRTKALQSHVEPLIEAVGQAVAQISLPEVA